MDKSLTAHYDYISAEISSLTGKGAKARAEELYYYHVDRVRDFQHERHIHLIVTLFFAGLLLLSVVGLLWIGTVSFEPVVLLTSLFGLVGVVLFVTVLLYIRHYYRLENGVQRLYGLSEKLHRIIAD